MSRRQLGFRWDDVRRVVWRPLAASSVMYFVVGAVDSRIAHLPSLARLAIDIPAGALTYAGVILLLWLASARPQGAETLVLARARFIPQPTA